MGRAFGVLFPTGTFSLLYDVEIDSGAQPTSYLWVPRVLSLGVKRLRRDADDSPSFSYEVKNVGAMPPLPHTSSWHGA
jgi:hypothetical protein